MNIEKQIDILIKGRELTLKLIEDLTLEQINKIPKGHNNHIGWNIGHLLVTQQLLCYKLSGLKALVSDELINSYKKGTDAHNLIIDEKEWEYIKNQFIELPQKLAKDYSNGCFEGYSGYTTSVKVELDSIEKAIDFNNFHEGVHLGVVLSQKKLV
ncbi:DinB family protein [Wenyingzhuangia sp. IMCC45533]